jgi:hypothetical protein
LGVVELGELDGELDAGESDGLATATSKDDSVHSKFNGRVKCSNLAPRRPSIKQLIEACREPKSILQFDASKPVCAAIDQMKSTLTFQRFIHSI